MKYKTCKKMLLCWRQNERGRNDKIMFIQYDRLFNVFSTPSDAQKQTDQNKAKYTSLSATGLQILK